MAVLADETTVAEAIESECRRVMARMPAAHWGTRAARRDKLAHLDRLLDQWLDATAWRDSP